MYCKRFAVEVTTDSSGDAEVYSAPLNGRVLRVEYVKDDFANGVDIDVTLESSGVTVWSEDDVNTSKTIQPREAVHGTDGAAASYADGYPREEPIVVADERAKIVVASGGDTKSGTFYITVG